MHLNKETGSPLRRALMISLPGAGNMFDVTLFSDACSAVLAEYFNDFSY
jgi:hypothetical protein